MPQSEIYKLLRKAVAGLLIPGINSTLVDKCCQDDRLHRNAQTRRGDCARSIRGSNSFDPSRLGIFLDGCVERRVQILSDLPPKEASIAGTR